MGKLEKIFSVCVLVISTGAVIYFVLPENRSVLGNPAAQILWSGVYVVTWFLLLPRIRQVAKIASKDIVLWLLVGLALLSVVWSAMPASTLQRGIAMIGTTLFGLYLTASFERGEVWRLMLWALGACVLVSLIFGLAISGYGIHQDSIHHGAWRGAYLHKNGLGRIMTLAALLWLLYAVVIPRYRWLGAGFAGLCGMLVVLSGSVSAQVLSVGFLICLPLSRVLRWYHVPPVLALLTVIVWVVLGGGLVPSLISDLKTMLALVGRDLTLTGRTLLWPVVWDVGLQSPWFGYGYQAFWLGLFGPSAKVWQLVQWAPPHAHNGFLDLWVQLGVLGVGLFAVSFISNLKRAVNLARHGSGIEAVFPLICLVFLLLYNTIESSILVRNSFFWILYVVISLQLHAAPEERELYSLTGLQTGQENFKT